MLRMRGEIVHALRDLFAELAFVEIETPALQVSPGNEIHLQAFGTDLAHADRRDRRYLRTSPEFACKKLIAAGERRIVEFRAGLSEWRALGAAPSRIHDARMVSRQ